jgi:hypothetical protein
MEKDLLIQEKLLFIDRYSDLEIESLIKSYDSTLSKSIRRGDAVSTEELSNFLLRGERRRLRIQDGARVPTRSRYDFRKSFEEYIKSDMPFHVLKESDFNVDICRKYFRWRHMVMHVLEMPMSELPLYLNSESKEIAFLAKWRLKSGK